MVMPTRTTTPTSTNNMFTSSQIKAFICSSKGMGIVLIAFITFLSFSSQSIELIPTRVEGDRPLTVEVEGAAAAGESKEATTATTATTATSVHSSDNSNNDSDSSSTDSKTTTNDITTSTSNPTSNPTPNPSKATKTSSGQLLPNCQVDSFPYKINTNIYNDINTTNTNDSNGNDNGNDNGNGNGNNNQNIRWSQRNVPTSTINSPFNCYLPNSLCTYYYPADFFDPKCGLGKQYTHFLQQAEEMRQNRTLWMYMPAVGFPTLTLNHTCYSTTQVNPYGVYDVIHNRLQNSKDNYHVPLNQATLHNIGSYTLEPPNDAYGHPSTLNCMTERVTMLHVHKVGGTSLHTAFDMADRMGRGKSVLQVRHKFFTPARGPDSRPFQAHQRQEHRTESPLYLESLNSLTKYATTYPEKVYEPEQHLVFAFVRDPVDRFISSLGQALGASGSQGNQIGPVLKEECVVNKETSAQVLKCIAKYVQEHGFWIELHFTPQVLDISFTTLWTDIPIAVYPFKELRTVLNYFGSGNVTRRDGGSDNYRSSKLLTDMTVDDYDEETLGIVCSIYEMDVIMQRSLGFDSGRCDPYVPK
jgi:hypothetical protein